MGPRKREAVDPQTKLSEALGKGLDAAYAVVEAPNFAQPNNGTVKISKRLVEYVASIVEKHGCDNVTSIGCGTGLFEWFLAKRLGKRIHVVDRKTEAQFRKNLAPAASPECVYYQKASKVVNRQLWRTVSVPRGNLLLFVWGLGPDWKSYLHEYKGSTVLFIRPDFPDFKFLGSLEVVEREFGTTFDIRRPKHFGREQPCHLLVRR